MVEKIKELANKYEKAVILSSSENKSCYNNKFIIDMGSKDNLDEIAKNIFSCLKKADNLTPDIVIIEGVKQNGVGIAIMNRLIKACNNNYIEI